MKPNKTVFNSHAQSSKTESDANLLGFFALLYKVDMRIRRERLEANEEKQKNAIDKL